MIACQKIQRTPEIVYNIPKFDPDPSKILDAVIQKWKKSGVETNWWRPELSKCCPSYS